MMVRASIRAPQRQAFLPKSRPGRLKFRKCP